MRDTKPSKIIPYSLKRRFEKQIKIYNILMLSIVECQYILCIAGHSNTEETTVILFIFRTFQWHAHNNIWMRI